MGEEYLLRKKPCLLEQYPNIAKFVIENFIKGNGYRLISKRIKKDYNLKVSHMAVKRFITKKLGEIGEEIQNNPKTKKEVVDTFLDTVTQMKQLNQKLWNLMDKLKETKANVPEIVALSKEIRHQVELQEKLLGRINQVSQITVKNMGTVNTIAIATQINKYLKKMEEKGWIIIKQHLKHKEAIEKFEELVEERSKYSIE